MAPRASFAELLIGGLATLVLPAAAADFVLVSADILNLRYEAIDSAGRAALSHGYATDIATALSLPVAEVRSLDGTSASVTVSAGAAVLPTAQPTLQPAGGGGGGHSDVRPTETTAAPGTTSQTGSTAGSTSLPFMAPTSTTEPASTTTPAASTTTIAPTTTVAMHAATTTTTATTAATTLAATTTAHRARPTPVPANATPAEMPPLWPMRGIAYGALPCKGEPSCQERGLPSQDMLQVGYAEQWGPGGRDDLGVMKAIGGNAVRMYHSFGLNTRSSHAGFLDRASQVGVNVMPGYHTEMTAECPDFDCFQAWKEATLKGFSLGYRQGNGWHPAVAMLILLNEPDFLKFSPQCEGSGAWCHVKAAVSALDGVLAAEREEGVAPGRVNLTIAWSFAMETSIDGKVTGPGYFGFQDVKAVVERPELVQYSPRSSQAELLEAYRTRWVNCLNTQAPWSFVRDVIGGNYAHFEPTPWFIGEYGANGQPRDVIEDDLKAMQHAALEKDSSFMGVTFFQFQTANQKGGSELNFGMFDLGTEQITETGEVCDDGLYCMRWPVYCLTPTLHYLPVDLRERARAVASAWSGTLNHGSLCGARRLTAAPSCRLGFYVPAVASTGLAGVTAALEAPALEQQFLSRTMFELGSSSPAIVGTLDVSSMTFQEQNSNSLPTETQLTPPPKGLTWWGWMTIGILAFLLAISTSALVCHVARGKVKQEQFASAATLGEPEGMAEEEPVSAPAGTVAV
mmetsp:Transcript_107689/g.332700  ORF Transcript_107689/g.332700 Transcript_107689/m.332700 type:complete len:741 (-) Transcript_107689:97-2319(-)